MKKLNSAALLMRRHLFAPGADKKKLVSVRKVSNADDETTLYAPSVECKIPSLKATRKFKIALISSYTFLISVFVGIVFLARILDPKFPF